ncbi:hypothetical protein GCM10028808_27450 [Spirosoma migulaei]
MPQPCPDKNPLQRDGLSQPQRRLLALQPESILLDERRPEDLLQFLALYAKKARIRFFDQLNTPDKGEAWSSLMDYARYFKLEDLGDWNDPQSSSRSDIEPHFALVLSFLHLFQQLQNQQNTLTKKHLDFYYHNVLQLTNRAPAPDHVHVLFELAKNAADQIVAKETELDAGKDPQKRPLTYKTANNLTVNRAKINYLRTVYRLTDPVTNKSAVYYAPVANTWDGVAEPLPPDNPTWSAFGRSVRSEINCGESITSGVSLPTAQLGFGLASPVLLLAEGERTITVTINTNVSPVGVHGLMLRVQLSGAKTWLDAKTTTAVVSGNTVTLAITLHKDSKEAVVAYDATKLDGGYATNAPMLRCWLTKTEDYAAWKALDVRSIRIDVTVTGLKKTLILENDLGQVSPEKPFMPFGSSPVTGSTLYVGSEEAVAKTLTSVAVHFNEWIGLPENWQTHYEAYASSYADRNTFKAKQEILNGNLKTSPVATLDLFPPIAAPPSSTNFVFLSLDYLPIRTFESVYAGPTLYVRQGLEMTKVYDSTYTPPKPEASTKSVSDSLLKITLNKDFGASSYPKLLTQGVIDQSKEDPGPQKIPNSPYLPILNEFTLDYQATTDTISLAPADINSFANRSLQLFHLGAFGQAEENGFLKQAQSFLGSTDKNAWLVPQYNPNGTFFMGLKEVGPLEAVAILVQVDEGSANPDRIAANVAWSVLVENQWRPLLAEDILSDTTNNLLTSGIIKFYLPKETSINNTILEAGFVWLRAELKQADGTPAPIDSVCNFVALHPQAVLADFIDQRNDPVHYNLPLPAETIQKSRQSLASVKSIKQPYASFGGKPKESDEAFYSRVSERLRHKQRAVSIWDYEHLVLQTFPTIYKAKCLNHTKLILANQTLKELSPGYVTVVVVPDLRNLKDVNRFAPKVDLNTLDQVTRFLQRRAGRQVVIQAVNPNYERIKLDFNVSFQKGYEAAVYKKVLQQDLFAYLTPWAFDVKSDIPFGGTLSKSTLINFMERLSYVNFVTEVKMMQYVGGITTGEDKEVVTASDARAVLTSCTKHEIRDFDGC